MTFPLTDPESLHLRAMVASSDWEPPVSDAESACARYRAVLLHPAGLLDRLTVREALTRAVDELCKVYQGMTKAEVTLRLVTGKSLTGEA